MYILLISFKSCSRQLDENKAGVSLTYLKMLGVKRATEHDLGHRQKPI